MEDNIPSYILIDGDDEVEKKKVMMGRGGRIVEVIALNMVRS